MESAFAEDREVAFFNCLLLFVDLMIDDAALEVVALAVDELDEALSGWSCAQDVFLFGNANECHGALNGEDEGSSFDV